MVPPLPAIDSLGLAMQCSSSAADSDTYEPVEQGCSMALTFRTFLALLIKTSKAIKDTCLTSLVMCSQVWVHGLFQRKDMMWLAVQHAPVACDFEGCCIWLELVVLTMFR